MNIATAVLSTAEDKRATPRFVPVGLSSSHGSTTLGIDAMPRGGLKRWPSDFRIAGNVAKLPELSRRDTFISLNGCNVKEFRVRAEQCELRAVLTDKREAKATFEELARQRRELAEQIERHKFS